MNKSGIKRTCSFSMSDVSCCLAGEGRGNGRTYPCWMNDRLGVKGRLAQSLQDYFLHPEESAL